MFSRALGLAASLAGADEDPEAADAGGAEDFGLPRYPSSSLDDRRRYLPSLLPPPLLAEERIVPIPRSFDRRRGLMLPIPPPPDVPLA